MKYCSFLGKKISLHLPLCMRYICTAKNLRKRPTDLVKQAMSTKYRTNHLKFNQLQEEIRNGAMSKKLLKKLLVQGYCQMKKLNKKNQCNLMERDFHS